jgi:hypothetical protein
MVWDPPVQASDGDIAAAYQVFRNGTLIGRPIDPTFIDTGLKENTSYNYEIYAVDNMGLKSQTSVSAPLSTARDLTPPEMTSIRIIDVDKIDVLFSERLEPNTATTESNYFIEPSIVVHSAQLIEDSSVVRLGTSAHIIGLQYTIHGENILDRASTPNAINPNLTKTYIGGTGDTLTIRLACDNQCELYINGNYMGSNEAWGTALTFQAQTLGGDNVIAVKGIDTGGEGGLVAEIDFNDQLFVSNESWKISTTEQTDWEKIGFSDNMWPKATSWGLHGVADPWAQYHNVVGISTTNQVHWIWSADYNNDNVVYFRLVLRYSGDNIPPAPPTGVTIKTQ